MTRGTLRLLVAGLLVTGCSIANAAPFAYLTLSDSDVTSRLDLATNEAINIAVGDRPLGVTASPDGSRVYVANFRSSNVSVIDTATDTVVAIIPVAGPDPLGMAITADGSRLYVANSGGTTVSVVDATTNAESLTIPLASGPNFIAINPAGTRVYVSKDDGRVAVINAATNAVVADVPVSSGGVPYGIVVNPGGTRVYTAIFNAPAVQVVDATTNLLIAGISLQGGGFSSGGEVDQLSMSQDGQVLYASRFNLGKVSVIDTASNTEVGAIGVGNGPEGLDLAPDGSRLYVNNYLSNSISIVDTVTNSVVATVATLGYAPSSYGKFITLGSPSSATTSTSTTTSTIITSSTTTTLPALSDSGLSCQKAVAASFSKFGGKAHRLVASCLNRVLKGVSGGTPLAAATAACGKMLDRGNPSSSVSVARSKAGALIATNCAGVTPGDLGSPCNGTATTVQEIADCVLDEQLLRIEQIIADEYANACGLLGAVGRSGDFQAVCAGP